MLVDHLQKTKKESKNLKKQEIHDIFIKTNLKLIFNMTWLMEISKISDKTSRDKAFNIAKNAKYDGYQRGLASAVYKCFDKKILAAVLKIKLFLIKN